MKNIFILFFFVMSFMCVSCGTPTKLLAGTELTDEIQGCYIVNASWYKNTEKPLNCKIIFEGRKGDQKDGYEQIYTLQDNFQIKAGEIVAIPIPAEKDIAAYWNADEQIYKGLHYRFVIGPWTTCYGPWAFLGKNVKIRITKEGKLYINRETSFPKYKKSNFITE